MKRFRAVIVLLFSIALPYSATSIMVDNIHCRDDGLGALLDSSTQHHHAAMRGHQTADNSGAHHGCDCAVKCDCQYHCAGGASSPLVLGPVGVDLPRISDRLVCAYGDIAFDSLSTSPFRPPIVAPPGAA